MLFQETLRVFCTYHITNARINPIKAEFRIVDNEYQWVIDTRTLVEEVEPEDKQKIYVLQHFVPSKDLPNPRPKLVRSNIESLYLSINK